MNIHVTKPWSRVRVKQKHQLRYTFAARRFIALPSVAVTNPER